MEAITAGILEGDLIYKMYQGNSIVDYLKSQGQATDFASRAVLAKSKGISGYTGSADQNTQLLNMLRNSAPAPAPVAQPSGSPAPQPQGGAPTPQQSPTASVGGPQSVQDLVAMGYHGYTGWDNAGALADFKATGGSGKGGPSSGGSGAGVGSSFSMPTINLPEIYNNLYNDSGITKTEQQLSDMTKAFNDAQSKINNNPFLSEASRVGRIQKLQNDFNNNTAGIRSDIATKKADIETKLNIQMKQFDINSEQAKQAMSQFNNLLASGALANASGEDIASITRSTGLSSSMIQSAIKAQKAKDIKTSTIQFDDGTNQGFAIINSDTGEIINKQVITNSKPKASGKASASETAQGYKDQAVQDAQSGVTLADLVAIYLPVMDIKEIYRLYTAYNRYGPPSKSSTPPNIVKLLEDNGLKIDE